jgi:predicted nucleic-acid-binding Zn-ribbon protein
MRTTETCPKCRSRKIYVVDQVGLVGEAGEMRALPVARGPVIVEDAGVFGGPAERIVAAGTFEAWVCGKCGFTEWYAKKIKRLIDLAAHSAAVRVIDHDPDPSAGPYRT